MSERCWLCPFFSRVSFYTTWGLIYSRRRAHNVISNCIFVVIGSIRRWWWNHACSRKSVKFYRKFYRPGRRHFVSNIPFLQCTSDHSNKSLEMFQIGTTDYISHLRLGALSALNLNKYYEKKSFVIRGTWSLGIAKTRTVEVWQKKSNSIWRKIRGS